MFYSDNKVSGIKFVCRFAIVCITLIYIQICRIDVSEEIDVIINPMSHVGVLFVIIITSLK